MRMIMRGGPIMALGLLAASGTAVAGPDANAIMKKAQMSMTGAKTYQATWVMTMNMGQMGSTAINMDMKMIPGQGKFAMKMTQAGTPTGMMAMSGAAMNNMQSIDDGKNTYMYIPM